MSLPIPASFAMALARIPVEDAVLPQIGYGIPGRLRSAKLGTDLERIKGDLTIFSPRRVTARRGLLHVGAVRKKNSARICRIFADIPAFLDNDFSYLLSEPLGEFTSSTTSSKRAGTGPGKDSMPEITLT